MSMLVRSKFIETRSRIEEDHSMDPTPFQHWERNLTGVYRYRVRTSLELHYIITASDGMCNRDHEVVTEIVTYKDDVE